MRCLDSRNQESVPRSFKSSRDESPWGFQDAGCPTLVDSLASRSTSRLVVGASFFSGSTGCHHQIEVDGRGERQKTAFVAVFAESERASLPFNSFEYDSTCAADCLKYSSRTAAAIHRIFVDRGRSETQNLQGWIALSWLHESHEAGKAQLAPRPMDFLEKVCGFVGVSEFSRYESSALAIICLGIANATATVQRLSHTDASAPD